jgi:membrane fusion protein, heavy metal efflux system
MLATSCGAPPSPPPESATDGPPATSVALSEEAMHAAGVELTPVRTIVRRHPVEATGMVTLDERRTARPGAILEGVVVAVLVQPGDTVSRGAILARLHSHIVHDALAAWFTALAERHRREHELGYAREAEARAERLLADKALSVQEVARAAADRVAAEQQLAMAQAEVTRAGRELAHYGIEVNEGADAEGHDAVPVRAPRAGVVVERLVSPGAAVTPGTPLFIVSDLGAVWVVAQVDERDAGRLTPGGGANITVTAYPGETFAGTIEAIGDHVDPSTRRITVRVAVENPDRRLKIGMFAAVALGDHTPREVLAVPAGAVQQIDGDTVVFVRRADGRFHRQAVTVGPEIDGWIEILSGVAAGDEVVSSGAFLLKSELVGVDEDS